MKDLNYPLFLVRCAMLNESTSMNFKATAEGYDLPGENVTCARLPETKVRVSDAKARSIRPPRSHQSVRAPWKFSSRCKASASNH